MKGVNRNDEDTLAAYLRHSAHAEKRFLGEIAAAFQMMIPGSEKVRPYPYALAGHPHARFACFVSQRSGEFLRG